MNIDVTKVSDSELFGLLAELDRRKYARLIQQIRSELAMRGVAYQEQQVTDAAGSRWQITPRQKVIPSRQPLLSGSAPVDWDRMQGQGFFRSAVIFACLAMLAPHWGIYPSHAVSHDFVVSYYLVVMLFGAIVIALAYPREFQTVLRKWVAEQLVRLLSLGLWAFALQIPTQLAFHQLLQQPWQQQAKVLDMQRNTEWCQHQVVFELMDEAKADSEFIKKSQPPLLDLCALSAASYDSLRPNDPVKLVGSQSAVAIVVTQIQLRTTAEPAHSL